MAGVRSSFQAAIFVMLINDKEEVWLQCRQGTSFLKGYFDFPSGHIESGESILDAATREVLEEARVVVNPNNLQLVHINQNYIDTPYINFTYVTHEWQGIPQIGEPHKCSDAGFYALDSVPEKSTLNVRILQNAYKPGDVTHSCITPETYREIMGEDY